MRRAALVVLSALVAASCSDANHPIEPTRSVTSALGAPTKVMSFTNRARSWGGAYGAPADKDGWVTLGNKTVFAAADVLHGKELWVTDGTAAGTSLLLDGVPGASGSLEPFAAHPFTIVSNGSVAVYPGNGPEGVPFAWRTDGTTAGTYPLREVVLPRGWMRSSACLGTSLFFSSSGSTVWKSDGSEAGTSTFWTGGSVYDMAAGTTKLFLAEASAGLYVTDGSATPNPVSGSPLAWDLTVVGDVVFYLNSQKSSELWKSDGTSASRVHTAANNIQGLHSFGAGIIFFIPHIGGGWELWKSDGTTTEMVSVVSLFGGGTTVVGTKAFFGKYPGIWVTDGSTAGTSIITDPAAGAPLEALAPSSGPAKYKDGVVFTGRTVATGAEPFFTNGNAASTAPVADVIPGPTGSNPSPGYHEGAAQTLFFFASPATGGSDIWKVSSSGAASLVKPIDAPTAPAPLRSAILGNKLYFTTVELTTSQQLWVSDGTTAGTTAVTTDADDSDVDFPTAMGGKIYFVATSAADGRELWVTDGTHAGTTPIDINPGIASANPFELVASGTHLFFSAKGASGGNEPYAYSAADGLAALGDLTPGDADTLMSHVAAFKGGLLFAANGTQWFSDGTAIGTVPISTTPAVTDPAVLGVNAIYGTATGLWKSDGTSPNTTEVKASTGISVTVTAGGHVYFARNGRELWRTDGSANGTALVADLGGSTSIESFGFTGFGNRVVFVAGSNSSGRHWYVSDGTAGGTTKLTDAAPGGCAPYVAGSTLYFCGADGAGDELWSSDGTPAGTHRWMDLNPGPARSGPLNLALLGTKLLFTAYQGFVPSLYAADVGAPNPASDAGTSSGSSSGTGVDASTPDSSAPSTSSSGAVASSESDHAGAGCGCRTTSSRESGALWSALAVLGMLVERRRRRAR